MLIQVCDNCGKELNRFGLQTTPDVKGISKVALTIGALRDPRRMEVGDIEKLKKLAEDPFTFIICDECRSQVREDLKKSF